MKRVLALMLTIASPALAVPAFAAERATLANGFSMSCHHHALIDGKMRLYTQPGDQSYIEFTPEEVTAIETVPDPPATPNISAQDTKPGAPSMSPPGAPFVTRLHRGTGGVTPADWHAAMAEAGHTHNLDVELLASVVHAESSGNPRATSRAGAQGLMQLMPKTASDLGVSDSYEPSQNVRGGATYLDALLTRYHDSLPLALAAYNAGPAAVDKYHGIPPYRETRSYVARVIREFNRRVRNRQSLRYGQ